MHSNKLSRFVTLILIFICASLLAAHADEADDLIEAILETSPTAEAKAQSYAATAAKRITPTKKAHNLITPKARSSNTAIPDLQIPEVDLLEVSSKFPKDFIGKYIYGPVTLHDFQFYEDDESALIGFTSKNWRGFYLETRDPLIIAKFSKLSRGMKFTIPREFPLRIVSKPGLSYILNMPYEKFQSWKEYMRQKQNKNNN
jgi:hypothetical protein